MRGSCFGLGSYVDRMSRGLTVNALKNCRIFTHICMLVFYYINITFAFWTMSIGHTILVISKVKTSLVITFDSSTFKSNMHLIF